MHNNTLERNCFNLWSLYKDLKKYLYLRYIFMCKL